jgi:hypothetical protein
MNPFSLLGSALGLNLVTSLVDNLVWTVDAPIRGSIVYCDLAFGTSEHSGIYIGNNQIVHRNGRGKIELVTPGEFTSGTTGATIYVSCDKYGDAVGYDDVAHDAESMLGTKQNYSLLGKNCHQFCSYCLSGDWDNYHVSLSQLKYQAKSALGASQWRAWSLLNR